MDVGPWWLVAVVLGVLVYVALPVALVYIYLTRVHAWFHRNKPKEVNRSAGKGNSDGGH